MEEGDQDELFKALSDPTRRFILDALTERDGQSLFEICARLASRHQVTSTRQAISQHLTALQKARLVTTERRGRQKLHFFDPAPLGHIAKRWRTETPSPDRKER